MVDKIITKEQEFIVSVIVGKTVNVIGCGATFDIQYLKKDLNIIKPGSKIMVPYKGDLLTGKDLEFFPIK